MRWFKHMSNASHDSFIENLETEFGLEGYARWWKLLEVVALSMDKTSKCSASHTWQNWQSFLKGKRNKLETFLEHLENESRIKLKQTGNVLEVEIPKMQELRDEWTRREEKNSGVTREKLPHKNTDTDSEAEKKKIKKEIPKIQNSDDFSVWYAEYPRKVARAQALKAYWNARNKVSAEILLDGVSRYRANKPDYADWKHPATWLNAECWDDENPPAQLFPKKQNNYCALPGNQIVPSDQRKGGKLDL